MSGPATASVEPPDPWTVGDDEERWNGYLIPPDHSVLRNLVGATSDEELRAAENDLLEYRFAELREDPGLVPRTYDLDHVRKLHRHFFQDVYAWAGELRTVGLTKGVGHPFLTPREIPALVARVAQRIARTDRLRQVPPPHLSREIAELYDLLNYAHPFREGNGRTQREFFAQLLGESGHGLAWDRIETSDLHFACEVARNRGDRMYLLTIINTALSALS